MLVFWNTLSTTGIKSKKQQEGKCVPAFVQIYMFILPERERIVLKMGRDVKVVGLCATFLVNTVGKLTAEAFSQKNGSSHDETDRGHWVLLWSMYRAGRRGMERRTDKGPPGRWAEKQENAGGRNPRLDRAGRGEGASVWKAAKNRENITWHLENLQELNGWGNGEKQEEAVS